MADSAPATASRDPHIRTNERDFLREVLETEAAAVSKFGSRVAGGEDLGLHAALDLLESCKGHVVVSGMGKSGLIGAKISASLSSLGQPSHFVHPAEAVHGDLGSIRSDDIVLLLSWSGETQEVVALASILKMDGIPTVGMSGKVKSSLARACSVHMIVCMRVRPGDCLRAVAHKVVELVDVDARPFVRDNLVQELPRAPLA